MHGPLSLLPSVLAASHDPTDELEQGPEQCLVSQAPWVLGDVRQLPSSCLSLEQVHSSLLHLPPGSVAHGPGARASLLIRSHQTMVALPWVLSNPKAPCFNPSPEGPPC